MKKILFILLAFLAVSCSKQKIADLNKDVKHPTNVPGQTLFSNAEKNLSDQIASINVNMNDFKLWAQYFTETTYEDESNYNIFNRNVPDNAWGVYYRDVLEDLKRSDSLISMEKPVTPSDIAAQKNKLTIIDILAVYTWDRMETMWGNIPYTQALNVDNVLPAYDDAMTIHKSLLVRISKDINALDVSNGSFGSADIIYNGDVTNWKAFANGLKVKMAIQVADVSSLATLVKTAISEAKAGTFTSAAQNAIFTYLSGTPNTNPLYVDLTLSGRLDFVGANTFIDKLLSLNDPRISAFFDQNLGAGVYKGGQYGHVSAYSSFSHINTAISEEPTYGNPLMTYSEIQFYLAEAAARGITNDNAITLYDNAITASFKYWGSSATVAAAYIAQPDVAYNQANWKKMIGTQAWISFYLRGYIAWTEWRRLDFPAMNVPSAPQTENQGFPYRFTYPSNEQTLNGANYTKAASAIGGDKLITKLYWDLH
jgi:hypothetical protein